MKRIYPSLVATVLALSMAAVTGAASAADIHSQPPANFKKVSTLVALPEYLPGLGVLYVDPATLPENVRVTHVSWFDGSLQGLVWTDRPALCFQGHPEASPGPHDVAYLFDRFIDTMARGVAALQSS